jgi:hypothetical protein
LFAAGLISDNTAAGRRQVIDISGDGPNNSGIPIEEARERVLGRGVTINGLPVVLRPGRTPIERYFDECVVGGPGAFTMTVSGIASFETSIRDKMVLEIAGQDSSGSRVSVASPPKDDTQGSLVQIAAMPQGELCDRWHRLRGRLSPHGQT